MRKIVYYVISFLTMILLLTCENNSASLSTKDLYDEKIIQNQHVQQSDNSFSMIVEFSGKLHNEAIVAFFEYAELNNIIGYDDKVYKLIEDFMIHFVSDKISANKEVVDCFYAKNCELQDDILTHLRDNLLSIISNGDDFDKIDQEIRCYLSSTTFEGKSEQENDIYQSICGVALATNLLWEKEWNYDKYPIGIITSSPSKEDDNDSSDEKGDEEEKKKDDLKKLKMADVKGALKGAFRGAKSGSSFGPAGTAWGGLIGASAGAAISSAAEAMKQKYSDNVESKID